MATFLIITPYGNELEEFERWLRDGSQHLVLKARSGEEGLELAFNHQIDIIFLENHLPKSSGLEIARILKEDHRTCRFPILLMTAQADRSINEEGTKIGIEGLIYKPISQENILFCVDHIVG